MPGYHRIYKLKLIRTEQDKARRRQMAQKKTVKLRVRWKDA